MWYLSEKTCARCYNNHPNGKYQVVAIINTFYHYFGYHKDTIPEESKRGTNIFYVWSDASEIVDVIGKEETQPYMI